MQKGQSYTIVEELILPPVKPKLYLKRYQDSETNTLCHSQGTVDHKKDTTIRNFIKVERLIQDSSHNQAKK